MNTLVLAPAATFDHYALASDQLQDNAPWIVVVAVVVIWSLTYWWTHLRKSGHDER